MVAAIEPIERPVVNGLKAILHHHPSSLGQLGQEVEDLLTDAVGPGADGQADDARMGEGLLVGQPQPVDRPVGVAAGLEVGHEPFGGIPAFQPADPSSICSATELRPARRLGLKLSGLQ